ncbi:MAG: hypothetical protein SAMD01599839_19670 [Rectinema sp.]
MQYPYSQYNEINIFFKHTETIDYPRILPHALDNYCHNTIDSGLALSAHYDILHKRRNAIINEDFYEQKTNAGH